MIKSHKDFRGSTYWHNSKGQLHRIKGPALEAINGDKAWYRYGELHRLDGPAIEYARGDVLWFYRGVRTNCSSQQEFEKLLKLKAFW